MGNCSSTSVAGELRLVTASVQVLGFHSAADNSSGDKRSEGEAAAKATQPCAFISSLKKSVSAPTSAEMFHMSHSQALSPTPAEEKPTATSQTTPSLTEIVLAAPLPHSRFCSRLRMRRTPDWDRVVMPLVKPGARLKVVYDPRTLMIHVLERDETETTCAHHYNGLSQSPTATSPSAKAR